MILFGITVTKDLRQCPLSLPITPPSLPAKGLIEKHFEF